MACESQAACSVHLFNDTHRRNVPEARLYCLRHQSGSVLTFAFSSINDPSHFCSLRCRRCAYCMLCHNTLDRWFHIVPSEDECERQRAGNSCCHVAMTAK